MNRENLSSKPILLIATLFAFATMYSSSALASRADHSRVATSSSTDCADNDRRCKRRRKRAGSGGGESTSPSESDRREERRKKRAERERERERTRPHNPVHVEPDPPRRSDREVRREEKRRAENERARREEARRAEQARKRAESDRRSQEEARRRSERDRAERKRAERRAEQERLRRAERERRDRTERRAERERQRQAENRRRIERERERREQARRSERVRNRERKQRRRDARNRYHDHHHHYRYSPRVIRRHRRWQNRYSTWYGRHHRYSHPGWPNRRINYPAPWPNQDRWNFNHIIDVSDNIESTFSHLYNHIFDNRWETGLARKAYEAWHASQVYSDAVEYYRSKMYFSVYELFHLEEKANALHNELSRYRGYDYAKRQLSVARYYINELLWQYNRQLGPIDQWKHFINEGDTWRNGISREWEESQPSRTRTNETFAFWWEKPHRSVQWDISRDNNYIDTLTIEATNTRGQVGKNGVSGITHVTLNFTDGSEIDLVQTDHSKFSSRSGQLVLKSEGDYLELQNPYSHLRVRSIEIQADSWVAPEVDVELEVTIYSKSN